MTGGQDYLRLYHFDPFESGAPEWWLRDFHRKHVPYFSGCSQVLDLGSGSGLFLEELQAAGIHGIGVEAYAPGVSKGRARGLTLIEADILTFLSSKEGLATAGKCDGVYCSHVLEHLDPPQVFKLFEVLHSAFQPGTRMRIITNNPEDISVLGNVFWGDLTHQRLYPAELLRRIAMNRGLTVLSCHSFLGLRIGKRQNLRRLWDRLFWGRHKWHPNLLLDCARE